MAAVPDQFLLYDTAVRQWVINTFGSCIVGKQFFISVGTHDRAFSEFVTPSGVKPDGRSPLPRAAITLEEPTVDDERFNPNVIRKLGYVAADGLEIYRANYPVPVNFGYTLNFWAEYQREMNLFQQQLLTQFKAQYKYITVDVDTISPVPVYGQKSVGMFKESGLIDTGNLEPGSKERELRRTFNFHLKGWLWDFDFKKAFTIKEYSMEWYRDENLTLLLSAASTPQREVFDQGDGSQTVFSGTLNRTPIIARTFLIDATVGSINIRGRDDGSGNIVDPTGNGISAGTIDYNTGAISVTYVTAPDALTDISVAYFNTVG